MTAIPNFDAKAWQLRELVRHAVEEALEPSKVKNVWGSLFDGFHPTPYLDGLVDVLETTDALYVLNALLNDKETAA